jgi:hypothetical protein
MSWPNLNITSVWPRQLYEIYQPKNECTPIAKDDITRDCTSNNLETYVGTTEAYQSIVRWRSSSTRKWLLEYFRLTSSLCTHAMKAYGKMKAWLHAFLTSTLNAATLFSNNGTVFMGGQWNLESGLHKVPNHITSNTSMVTSMPP